MLHYLETFLDLPLEAADGDIGRARDFLFDDRDWIVRYLVADTGNWLPGRKVLIPPDRVLGLEPQRGRLSVDLDKEQVRSAPAMDTHAPVSRQYEIQLADHYRTLRWWIGPGAFGAFPTSASAALKPIDLPPREKGLEEPHLRAFQEVRGYGVAASDGDGGRLDGLLVDEERWSLDFLVVVAGNRLQERRVVIPRGWVSGFSWHKQSIRLDRSREALEAAPEVDPERPASSRLADLLRRRFPQGSGSE